MADGVTVNVKVEIFPQRLQQVINDPGGPVSLRVKQTADAVLKAAIPLIGTRYSGHHPGRPRLKDSGSVVKGSAGGADWAVQFNHPIALMHHNGTRAHTIGSPGKRLYNPRNPARTAGGPFAATGVVEWRPTVGANPFLIKAAQQLGLQPSGALRRGSALTSLFRTSFA